MKQLPDRVSGNTLAGRKCAMAIILGALAVSLGPTTPLHAADDLLQQFKALQAALKRDFNALPSAGPAQGHYAIEDVDGPIRNDQILMSNAMQESRIWAQYAGRLRSLLARDPELAPYGEKAAQIYSQISSLCKEKADIERQELAKSQALKTLGPHTDINAWNHLMDQRNSLDSKAAAIIGQQLALLDRRDAINDDIQNRLQKRQSGSHTGGLANSSTTSDAFGTRKANPKLLPAEKGTIGSNTKAGDQLKAAGKEAKKGDRSDFRKNFDEGGAQGDGSLAAAHTLSAGPPTKDPVIPRELQNDPKVTNAVTKRAAARSDIQRIETELKTLSPSNPKDQVKIAQLRDKEQRDQREVQYENYSIGEQISALPGGQSKKKK